MPVSRLYSTPTPFNASELDELDFEQVGDVLYFAHENHAPTKLVRSGHVDWDWSVLDFKPSIDAPAGLTSTLTRPNRDQDNDGNSYFPQNATYVVTAYNEDTGQESRPSNTTVQYNDLGLKRNYNQLTWSAVSGATHYRVYKSDNTQQFGYIGNTSATTFRDDNIGADLSEGPPSADNPFAVAGDYPGCITFHEQRAFWGRSRNRPNGIWGSRSADYENMDFHRPLRSDDALALGLVATKLNSINKMISTKQGLLALTSNNIFLITGSDEDFISASPPPRAVPEAARGSSRLDPIRLDSVIIYQTSEKEVHTLGYEFQYDGIRTNDVTIFSRHLFERLSLVSWDYARLPGSVIWAVRSDGSALAMTWDQAQEVWGWTLIETDGLFKGVCVVRENGEDRPYFLIERTIEGQPRLFIERMASALWEDQVDACYLDCAVTALNPDGEPSAIVRGLGHLEGKTVMAFADGKIVPDLIVADGLVTLPFAAQKVHVGLPFTAQIKTLPLAMQTRAGWNIAKPQAVGSAVIRVVNTRGILAGSSEDQLFQPKDRNDEAWGEPDALFTGDYEIDTAGVSGNEVTLIVRSSDPVPMTVSAILVEPNVAN